MKIKDYEATFIHNECGELIEIKEVEINNDGLTIIFGTPENSEEKIRINEDDILYIKF